MRKEIIFAVLGAIIITNSISLEAICVSEKFDLSQVENDNSKFISLKEDEIEKLNEFLVSIKDLETKRKVKEIFDVIVTDDGKFDAEAAEKLALEYYHLVSKKVGMSLVKISIQPLLVWGPVQFSLPHILVVFRGVMELLVWMNMQVDVTKTQVVLVLMLMLLLVVQLLKQCNKCIFI